MHKQNTRVQCCPGRKHAGQSHTHAACACCHLVLSFSCTLSLAHSFAMKIVTWCSLSLSLCASPARLHAFTSPYAFLSPCIHFFLCIHLLLLSLCHHAPPPHPKPLPPLQPRSSHRLHCRSCCVLLLLHHHRTFRTPNSNQSLCALLLLLKRPCKASLQKCDSHCVAFILLAAWLAHVDVVNALESNALTESRVGTCFRDHLHTGEMMIAMGKPVRKTASGEGSCGINILVR